MTEETPRQTSRLYGHEAVEATLASSVRSGRLHHAWLLTGPAGIGKATLAYRFARWLLAGAPEGESSQQEKKADSLLWLSPEHPVFRRVAADTHADLLSIEAGWDERRKRQRTEIVVDDVREIASFLHLTPAEGGWRVVIVDGADTLNRHAANALLKVLEEPPPRAILLLSCSSPGRLLPTIRSRCRMLRLQALEAAPMKDVLATLLPDLAASERDLLAGLSEGAPGRALQLAKEDGLALSRLAEDILRAPPSASQRHDLADMLTKGDTAFSTFMLLLRAILVRMVRQAARSGSGADEFLCRRPLDGWSDVWHALGRLQDETERFHLDKRQAIFAGLSLLDPS
ncbi:DNA polymerase III, delta' subunit [Granulibacter bethesdensis]|uniref:DNA polymerase III subunit delta' n=1 Tax=Granulibacter bethesdensis TaxID=364410 RepID=UPI00090A6AD0|nr:DNA polymerase III subunit delta' [Granulibacter bethesdensis]APH56890.1 DNA polymerase III, delta' subunit [Granulibacter bethesdensis]